MGQRAGQSAGQSAGYRATARDRRYLRLWKEGRSIGFTMRSSLKAKGLIPRSDGSYRVSKKYHQTRRISRV